MTPATNEIISDDLLGHLEPHNIVALALLLLQGLRDTQSLPDI
jgi:hypothetical protein